MPIINIQEEEASSYKIFDATENTVLIPMLYTRNYTQKEDEVIYSETDNIPGMLFTDIGSFKTVMWSHRIYIDENAEILDRSYIMAYELLQAGLNVVIKPITFPNADNLYHPKNANNRTVVAEDYVYGLLCDAFNNGALDEFKDRNLFNIKFITTGGYANKGKLKADSIEDDGLALDEKLVEIASERGDAIALVEFRELFKDKTELLTELSNINSTDDYSYAAAFFPWCKFTVSATGTSTEYNMPASFAYLMAYANSVKNNANWFAAAGVIRGEIPNLVRPLFDVGESLMHVLQGDYAYDSNKYLTIRVNPIYNAGTYGYRIWGNRVFDDTSSNGVLQMMYRNFLNVRVLLCDIKKQIFHAAMRTTFEPNDDIVWINFKGLANTLLERMVSGRGLRWYKWTKEKADDKAKIKATLTIRPIEAVESFDINIILTEDETTVAEQTATV